MIWPILVAQHTLAQATDNFSDGDFTSNPAWTGEDSKFSVIDGQLRLQAPAATGSAYLSTPSEAINDATWEFSVKLDFNPSGSNYARIHLVSDNPDLSGSTNGYFVMVGGATDEVSLYKQTGTTREEIIDGVDGRLNMTVASVRIKVTRDGIGTWALFTDIGNTGSYVPEGVTVDNTHSNSGSFGVVCVYTATRSTRFYFDDIKVEGDPFKDIVKPELQQLNVVSSNKLELVFSEKLDPLSAEIKHNYGVSNNIGDAVDAELSTDQRTILLAFVTPFPSAIYSRLSISGVKDLAGNEIDATIRDFVFFEPVQANAKDIIITEIFCDPDPAIGLPALEYVEIFNRSVNPFQLSGWQLTDGSSAGEFQSIFLLPGEYLIVTPDAEKFTSYGNVISVLNFPTLNNSGDVLVLKDENGDTIDSVSYSDLWYHDDDKKTGGWSLELIDVQNICAESDNWIAAEDERGGTPGKRNSVYAYKPDLFGPKLLSAIPLNPTEIKLVFDEKLSQDLPQPDHISIEPDNSITDLVFADETLTGYLVKVKDALQYGVKYIVTLRRVYDCTGNSIQTSFNAADFGLTENPDSLDVLVNEILFNPRPTGVDFVEVVNHSDKYLNLKNWSLANFEDGKATNLKAISSVDLLLKPGAYLVLTEESNVLKGEYPLSVESNFLELKDLPSFNDDEGSVAVLDNNGIVIDRFKYVKDLHSPFVRDDEGVSLERISLDAPSEDFSNWRSANTAVGYATPGYVNSNARRDLSLPDESVTVEPEIFSPLASHQNFVQINYRFGMGGSAASVRIIDPAGRVVWEVANNELLGTDGFFRWDGQTANGSKAGVGYYMVWFEVFNENGSVNVFKRRVAVAGQF